MALLTFGEFRLDTNNKRLWRGEQLVDLSGIHLAVLCHLVERSTEPTYGPDDDEDRQIERQARAAGAVLARRAGQRGDAAQLHERHPQGPGR